MRTSPLTEEHIMLHYRNAMVELDQSNLIYYETLETAIIMPNVSVQQACRTSAGMLMNTRSASGLSDTRPWRGLMNTDDLIMRSIHIVTEYYHNNLEPFFENISDDVLWIGPAERQTIQGKDNLIETFATERHALTFTMGNIKARCISPHTHVKEIVLHYDIYTHYPSGTTDMHDQILHYTWRDQREKVDGKWKWHPEIILLHISNLWDYDSRDTIYPVHYENVYMPNRLIVKPERYVTAKTVDGSVYRLLADRILYIETVKRSARLLMHTTDGEITIHGTLPKIEQENPDLFVRIHASYLINPSAVQSVHRFATTLSDGTELPIPEKKYTKIKKLLIQEDTSSAGEPIEAISL